ncbi:hypothetical protein [Amycolatopsis sp. NPDC004079]|uniref:hypothetical protein n=1 Tax=Amycolatopsis sp. NPDC004079 TaxID=3154549 RepID=UPI00339F20A4
MPTNNEHPPDLDGPALRAALYAEKDVQPIQSTDDLARDDVFETLDEIHEFQAATAAARKADLA